MREPQIVLTRSDKLESLLTERSIRRMLVFHGRSSYASSGGKQIVESLPVAIKVCAIGNIPENPEYMRIVAAAAEYRAFQPDAILAIGGGSVIDTAKAVLAASGGNTPQELFAERFALPKPKPLTIVMPTTSGSGAEATHFAVVYRDGVKYSLAHQALLPDAVVLDPETTMSCPVKVTLSSGADAVCQAIESYWSNSANSYSRKLSLKALPLLLNSIHQAADNPNDLQSRKNMQQGAHFAGQAINITKTTAGHALSYGLTVRFGISHGLSVLLVMRQLVPLMIKGFRWNSGDLDAVFLESPYKQNFENGFESFAGDIVSRFDLTGLFDNDGLDRLTDSVNVERLNNHPVEIERQYVHKIYKNIIFD